MPDEKEALRKEMEKKEAKRAARAKKALDEFEAKREVSVRLHVVPYLTSGLPLTCALRDAEKADG
jgi:hypothetical protein